MASYAFVRRTSGNIREIGGDFGWCRLRDSELAEHVAGASDDNHHDDDDDQLGEAQSEQAARSVALGDDPSWSESFRAERRNPFRTLDLRVSL